MTSEAKRQSADELATIEIELLRLVRQLESLGRRSNLYSRVDRAGYLAMRTLHEFGPLTTNALAEALHLDASTVTRQASAMEEAGLIHRRTDPRDRRSSVIMLTTSGRQVMRSVERRRLRQFAGLTNSWSSADRVLFGELLGALNESLGERTADLRAIRRQPEE